MNKTELTKKIQEAVLDMMSKVKFINDNDEHRYEALADGSWLQGVSTVSNVMPKDWLAPWGAKETAKALGYSDYEGDTELASKMWEKIKNLDSVEKYQALLKDAKGASRKKSKEALVDGTAGHAWLEKHIKASIRGQELPEVPTGNLERPITQFLEWEKENVDYWILSEARVADIENKYAGTLDGLCMLKNGRLALIDFKFASHMSFDYHLQTAGYQNTFEKYGVKIDDRIIIRLPKTLLIDNWIETEKRYEKVVNKIEVKVVDTPYERDIQAFISALPVKQWVNWIENNYQK